MSADIAQVKLEEYRKEAYVFLHLCRMLRVEVAIARFLLGQEKRNLADFLVGYLPKGFADMRKDEMERHLVALMQRVDREAARSVRRTMKKLKR